MDKLFVARQSHQCFIWRSKTNTRQNHRANECFGVFSGFEGKLQTSKWAKITKVSTDTALRDIKDLIEKGILQETNEGGRNANYKLADFTLE